MNQKEFEILFEHYRERFEGCSDGFAHDNDVSRRAIALSRLPFDELVKTFGDNDIEYQSFADGTRVVIAFNFENGVSTGNYDSPFYPADVDAKVEILTKMVLSQNILAETPGYNGNWVFDVVVGNDGISYILDLRRSKFENGLPVDPSKNENLTERLSRLPTNNFGPQVRVCFPTKDPDRAMKNAKKNWLIMSVVSNGTAMLSPVKNSRIRIPSLPDFSKVRLPARQRTYSW